MSILAATSVATSCFGCDTPSPDSPPIEYRDAQQESDEVLDALLADAHNAYVGLDQSRYRIGILAVMEQLSSSNASSLPHVLERTLAAAADGADGLEPVLIAAVDGISLQGDEDDVAEMHALLEGYGETLSFVVDKPNSAFIMPLSRVSTQVVLDVRADAVRAVTHGLLNAAQSSDASLDLDTLLAQQDLLGDLCALPTRNQGHDRGIVTSERQATIDGKRHSMCDEDGLPGGSGTSGGAAGALTNLAESACIINPSIDVAATTYTMQDQVEDISECVDTIAGSGGDDPGGIGSVADGGFFTVPVIVAIVIAVIGTASAGAAIYNNENNQELQAEKELNDAVVEWKAAWREHAAAVSERITADKALKTAKTAQADAQKKYDDDPSDANKKELDEKKKDTAAAKKAADDAKAQEKKKAEAQAKAADKHKAAVKNKEAAAPGGGEFAYSDDCEAASLGVFASTPFYKAAEEILEQVNPLNGVAPHEGNWAPDSDHGVNTVGLLPCGAGPATSQPGANSTCSAVAHCAPDDPHCACETSIPTNTTEVVQSLGEIICSATMDCEFPSMGAMGCSCGDGENPDLDAPEPIPDVAGPGGRFVALTFGGKDQLAELADLTQIERFTAGATRSDVGPAEAFSEGFGN